MSNAEHYFENLLFNGHDCGGEPNKKALTEKERAVVEQCAVYVLDTLFGGVSTRHILELIDGERKEKQHGTTD